MEKIEGGITSYSKYSNHTLHLQWGNRHSLWSSDTRVIWRFPQVDISKLILHKEDILTEDGLCTGIRGLEKYNLDLNSDHVQTQPMSSNSSLGDELLHTLTWVICNQDRSLRIVILGSSASTSDGIIQIQDRSLACASPEAARMSQSAL